MPELPEVEVVRRGLAPYVTGRTIVSAEVRHPRAVRRDPQGAAAFGARLAGQTIACVSRRGKYLWFRVRDSSADDPAGAGEFALVAHLGMSGQLLLPLRDEADGPHLRVRLVLAGLPADSGETERELRFVDQRTFGGMLLDELVSDDGGGLVPSTVAHVARDPLDPLFDDDAFVRRLRRSTSGVKRCLLDQRLVSGIGNIYADETLWRARLHYDRAADRLTRSQSLGLLRHARDVMSEALAQGGTSFDSLYVNVNGESGWFARSLDAYGREGEPCHRCGRPLVRESWTNRSSYRCPRCQPRGPLSDRQRRPA